MRLILLGLLALSGFLFSRPAAAGYYTSIYSGGTWYAGYSSSPYEFGYWGYGYTGSYEGIPACALSSGTITVTFTWVPDFVGDDPPASCIVEENSVASASWTIQQYSGGYVDPSGTATADSGIPDDPPVITSSSTSGSAHSYGNRTTVKNDPGTSFTVSCTPDAFAAASTGFASTDVQYRAMVYPVKVVFSGTRHFNGQDQALVGQGITASLVTDYPLAFLTQYQWDIAGGEPFKNFFVTPDATSANPELLDGFDRSHATCHFYCAKDEQVTVTCHADCFSAGIHLPVVGSAKVNIVAPAYAFTPTLGQAFVVLQGGQIVSGVTGAGPLHNFGALWSTSVPTPAPFNDMGQGRWHYLQTITPSFSYTAADGPHPTPGYGLTGLDTAYPYDPAPFVRAAGDTPGWWLADGMPQPTVDTPLLFSPTTANSIAMDFDAKMYVMFMPPGIDVQWVPLARHWWAFSITAVRPPTGNWADWSVNQMGNTLVGAFTKTQGRWTQHPIWTRRLPN